MVPFNDLRRRFQPLKSTLLDAWSEFIEAGVYIGGDEVASFENRFASYNGVPHCVAMANGTDALELALRAVGVKRGDEVITVANAGGYTTTACHAIDAVAVYIDVDPVTSQLNLGQVPLAMSQKTRAIVVTHLYGWMNDVVGIRATLASQGRNDIRIVEDCAQAHGASQNGAKAGSLGDAGVFSFYPTKNLGAMGDAGAVTSHDSQVAKRLRALRQYGWQNKYESAINYGRNSRMDPIQAVVLKQGLTSLDRSNTVRREICKRYRQHLPEGWSMVYADSAHFVGHLAVLVAPDAHRRDEARTLLSNRGIGCDIHYPILDCDQPAWRSERGAAAELPTSRSLISRILSVPLFPELKAEEVDQVIDALHSI